MSVTRFMIWRLRCRVWLPAMFIVDLLQSGVRRSRERSGADRLLRPHQGQVAQGTYISSAPPCRDDGLDVVTRSVAIPSFNGEEHHESWVH